MEEENPAHRHRLFAAGEKDDGVPTLLAFAHLAVLSAFALAQPHLQPALR